MADRLTSLKDAAITRTRQLQSSVEAAYAWASPRVARGLVLAGAALRHVWAFAKRALVFVLLGLEKALLTHAGRERTQATAVFVLIAAFAVTSVDFLLTGGPEMGYGARAAPYTSHVSLIAPSSGGRAEAVIEVALSSAPPEEDLVAADTQPEVVQLTLSQAPDVAGLLQPIVEELKAPPEGQPERATKDKA